MKGKLLLLGAGGQLGKSFRALFESDDISRAYDLFSLGHSDLDVTSEDNVYAIINDIHPDIVINATAYTAVDNAEEDQATCFAVNADAPGYIASACAVVGAKLIHVSTDYVYNGDIELNHSEDESPKPTGVYAASKLEGDNRALQNCADTIVIRTSWLYSPYGKNFVKTIGNLSFLRSEIKVVDDQYGNPTYAHDLAKAITQIIKLGKWSPGIYNYCNKGTISWYEFAKEIISLLGNAGKCDVIPIDSASYPAKVKRPKYSALNCDKISCVYSIEQVPWRISLARMIDNHKDSFNSVSNNR